MDEFDVKELLKECDLFYLTAYKNEWIDAEEKRLHFDDMSMKHLKNCHKMLKEQKEYIELGFFLQYVKYDKSKRKEIIEITKKIYYNKIEEIENYIE